MFKSQYWGSLKELPSKINPYLLIANKPSKCLLINALNRINGPPPPTRGHAGQLRRVKLTINKKGCIILTYNSLGTHLPLAITTLSYNTRRNKIYNVRGRKWQGIAHYCCLDTTRKNVPSQQEVLLIKLTRDTGSSSSSLTPSLFFLSSLIWLKCKC